MTNRRPGKSSSDDEFIQILKIPCDARNSASARIANLDSMIIHQRPHRKSIATRLFLSRIAPRSRDQPVIKLVQEHKQRQPLGIRDLDPIQLAPPTPSVA